MEVIQNLIVAFFFSFIGSIPPGTINLTALQLGLERRVNIAWRFAVAAAIVEFPYAWVAVKFQDLITSSPMIVENFQLTGSLVMIVLGGLNLWSAKKPTGMVQKFQNSGFRRGLLLGILNPMAIPFWIGVTAYLRLEGWIQLNSNGELLSYLTGISLGALALLLLLSRVAKGMAMAYQPGSLVKFIPGIVLLALGLYTFVQYLF